MKRILNLFFVGVLISIPVLCYVFLDQLYVKRFSDFSNKWLARESHHLKSNERSLSQILQRYEDVVSVSDDLKGFGISRDGKIVEFFGEKGPDSFKLDHNDDDVFVQRIGFLEYRTMVLLNRSNSTIVFFNFQDDTSVYDLIILILAMLSTVGIAVFARARIERSREETAQKTTVLTIQSMAHDFRAPFGKLRIFMTQLQRLDPKVFGELKGMRDALDAAVDHADDILTDFLSLNTKAALAPFECQKLIERIETKYFKTWSDEYPKIKPRFDCPQVTWVLANEQKTLRVLFNLLDNALKHARSRAELSIRSEEGRVLFSVTNDGPEIPKDQMRRIFKPFHSKRKGGLGLGLFICNTFIRAQGSKLRCSSKEDATVFSFSFPLASAPKTLQQSADARSTEARYHIAYVDDEDFYRKALETALKDSTVSVSVFQDTDSLLMAIKSGKTHFDLLLVDRFGPNFDAVEDRFQESCRDYGYRGPIVLYSNSVTSETEFMGFTKVFDKVKSLNAPEIIDIIEESKNEKI